jgi:hypothetical protein
LTTLQSIASQKSRVLHFFHERRAIDIFQKKNL